MISNIVQNRGKRADSQWIMIRNCNVMSAVFASRQANMAAGLPCYLVADKRAEP